VGAVGKERPGGRVKSSACTKAASVAVTGAAVVLNLVWPRPLVLTRSLLAALDSPPWVLLRGRFALLPDRLGKDLNLCLPPSTSFSSSLNFFRASKASASLSSCSISLTAAFCWTESPVLSTKLELLEASTFLLTVLRSASSASCLSAFSAVAGFLKLTRTICSLDERKPLGWDTVPTAEVPWNGVLSLSSSSCRPLSTRSWISRSLFEILTTGGSTSLFGRTKLSGRDRGLKVLEDWILLSVTGLDVLARSVALAAAGLFLFIRFLSNRSFLLASSSSVAPGLFLL